MEGVLGEVKEGGGGGSVGERGGSEEVEGV